MTRLEWDERMRRWAHRRNIDADLDAVWQLSATQFYNAWMVKDVTFASDDELLAAAPSCLHHAGLMHIHELAQDDESLSREVRLFNQAMTDFALDYSIRNIRPVSTRPYYDEQEGYDAP